MDLVVIGEGGHSKVIKDLIHSKSDVKIIAVLDDKYDELTVINEIYIGPTSSAHLLLSQRNHLKFVIAIGNNEVRKSIVTKLGLAKENYVSLIHHTAIVSSSASIGIGTVIMANTIVSADTCVGDHVIINSGAIVEHDNHIGDYAHIAPKATLTGSVTVKEGTMIGAGATVIPGKSIGEWAIIGAGATVISDIPTNSTAVGTPAKIISSRKFA
ncbi:acetyltransferase [Paenibacillus sp. CGMCC 1.16610]|uniref:Acetyltransferase n=1 Tax=Paenibacillus anseongense TaxID=2682845 RepID=A0ABW9U4N8_9BACL|nr:MULTISPECIES: acetyltransferase [Paenibacillus]MBA2943355.1 acetyltransferase [Paenibacillus sp. CGMCC 1.16610]MVQ33853.1 acetyltransferase [Paenibacillus anseongense]